MDARKREKLLLILASATLLIFFQAYMVAPLLPRFAELFNVPVQKAGVIVPAYMIPYGISTLFLGILADRIGRKKIMLLSFGAFIVLTFLTMTVQTIDQFIAIRVLTGIGACGIIPLALALVGQLYPFEERGRPLGWLFGAMAGGMSFGSTLGAVAEPYIGWQSIFGITATLTLIIFLMILPYRSFLGEATHNSAMTIGGFFNSYKEIFLQSRARKTFSYVFLNAVFHSGLFTWLGLYFKNFYNLSEPEIGIAILGYGIPGLFLGPIIGKLADKYGRRWLLSIGLGIASLSAFLLATKSPLLLSAVAVTALSLGYDMTQPLFAGIVTVVGSNRPGQAMGLNVFLLFLGFGVGSALFGSILDLGLTNAILVFAVFQLILCCLSIPIFRQEKRLSN